MLIDVETHGIWQKVPHDSVLSALDLNSILLVANTPGVLELRSHDARYRIRLSPENVTALAAELVAIACALSRDQGRKEAHYPPLPEYL